MEDVLQPIGAEIILFLVMLGPVDKQQIAVVQFDQVAFFAQPGLGGHRPNVRPCLAVVARLEELLQQPARGFCVGLSNRAGYQHQSPIVQTTNLVSGTFCTRLGRAK